MLKHLSQFVLISIFAALAPLSSLAGEFSRPLRANLYDDYDNLMSRGFGRREIARLNFKALQEINSLQIESNSTRIDWVTFEQASLVLQSLNSNPVTKLEAEPYYDPEGRFGFCFGRALYVHLELLRRGVNKNSIKKIFAVGPMRDGEGFWQFHVATLVKGPQGQWLAIDRLMDRPVTLQEWMKEIRKISLDKKLRFYLTEPSKIGPSGWEYNTKPGGLLDPSYNGYFRDLFQYFRNNPLSCQDKFN